MTDRTTSLHDKIALVTGAVLDRNVLATILTCRRVARAMIPRRAGRSSITGQVLRVDGGSQCWPA
jgi:hypothetical protein